MWLSVLWAAVSLATQSVLGRLLIDVSQVDVVGEMVARFQDRAEWCSRLETSGSRVYNLFLGPEDDRVHLVIYLEETIGRLQAMQDEHQALRNSATRVWDLVLERSDEAPSLAAALSITVDVIEGRVDAAATNGVHWGAWLVLTAILSHFPELELLGSGYNANLAKDEMEVF
jgi:hypothetical protein